MSTLLGGNSEIEIESRADDIIAKLDQEEAGQGAPEGRAQEQDSAPAPAEAVAEAGPEETQVTAANEEGQSDPAQPVIEPPDSWKAEAKDAFKKLPRDLQAVIAEREAEQKSAFNRQVTEAAEQRKAAEAVRKAAEEHAQAVAQERQRLAQMLPTLAQKLYAQDPIIAGEAQTDWVKLWQENPAEAGLRKARFEARIGQINAQVQGLAQEHEALIQKAQADHAEKMKAHLAQEDAKLVAKIPEWANPEVGAKAIGELRKTLVDSYGFTPQEVAVIPDHRYAVLARDAAAYHAVKAELDALKAKTAKTAQAVEQKRVPAQPTKTARPGNANEQGAAKTERGKALIQQAKKVRNIHDKAALLADAI